MITESVILAVLATIIYAGSEFLKKYLKPDNLETFDYVKFTATLIVGGVVGAVAGFQGTIPTSMSVAEQLALYAGATVVLENVLKIMYRHFRSDSGTEPE